MNFKSKLKWTEVNFVVKFFLFQLISVTMIDLFNQLIIAVQSLILGKLTYNDCFSYKILNSIRQSIIVSQNFSTRENAVNSFGNKLLQTITIIVFSCSKNHFVQIIAQCYWNFTTIENVYSNTCRQTSVRLLCMQDILT